MPGPGDLSGVMTYAFVMAMSTLLELCFCNGHEHSAGVIILKNNFNGSIKIVWRHCLTTNESKSRDKEPGGDGEAKGCAQPVPAGGLTSPHT